MSDGGVIERGKGWACGGTVNMVWGGWSLGYVRSWASDPPAVILPFLCYLREKMKIQAIYNDISEVTQSCLTLCDPMDCSLPGSPGPWNFPGKSTGVT